MIGYPFDRSDRGSPPRLELEDLHRFCQLAGPLYFISGKFHHDGVPMLFPIFCCRLLTP